MASNCQSKPPSQTRRRRVRFSSMEPCESVLPPRDQPNEEIWWQAEDYERFRSAAMLLVQTIRRDANLLDCVARAYKVAGLVASKISDEAKLSQVLTMVRVDQRITALWCGGYSYRGLERQVGPASILHPGALEQKDKDANETTLLASNKSEDELGIECETKSRQNRIFARLMGAADAAVVAFQDDNKHMAVLSLSSRKLLSGIKQRQFHPKQA